MATSAVLIRATVVYLDTPFSMAADSDRTGHFTFFSSLASALNIEFLAAASPANYLPLFARLDVIAKLVMALVSTANYSRDDPRRLSSDGSVDSYYVGAALSTFGKQTYL